MYVGRIDRTTGAIRWLEPALDNPTFSGFDYERGWGAIWSHRTLGIAVESSARQDEVYTSQGNLMFPRSNGERIVFAEQRAGTDAVYSLTAGASAPDVLVEGTWDVVDLAVSTSHVVWVGASGPRTREGSYETASLRWMPLDAASYDDEHQLELPITRSADKLTTLGNWVLLGGCEGDACGVHLADLTQRTLHRRRPATSTTTWRPFGIIDDRLLVTEEDADAPPAFFSKILEYRVSDFIAASIAD